MGRASCRRAGEAADNISPCKSRLTPSCEPLRASSCRFSCLAACAPCPPPCRGNDGNPAKRVASRSPAGRRASGVVASRSVMALKCSSMDSCIPSRRRIRSDVCAVKASRRSSMLETLGAGVPVAAPWTDSSGSEGTSCGVSPDMLPGSRAFALKQTIGGCQPIGYLHVYI